MKKTIKELKTKNTNQKKEIDKLKLNNLKLEQEFHTISAHFHLYKQMFIDLKNEMHRIMNQSQVAILNTETEKIKIPQVNKTKDNI